VTGAISRLIFRYETHFDIRIMDFRKTWNVNMKVNAAAVSSTSHHIAWTAVPHAPSALLAWPRRNRITPGWQRFAAQRRAHLVRRPIRTCWRRAD
jgi:hypothetical protein